jgi:hypothetical protein
MSSSDYADEEGHEDSCNECGGMMEAGHSCGSKEMVDEVESEDQMEFEVAEDNAPDSGEAESTADEDAEDLDPKAQKERIKQYKKVWNDERRAKEAAQREQQEAIELARRVLDENKKLKAQYSAGEKTYIETVQSQTETQVAMAKREYREALESGDADRIVEAQSALNDASYKAQQAKQFRPTALQEDENEVQIQQVEQQRPRIDAKTQDWLDENPWYGTKKAMSNFAVGIHEELVDEYGKDVVGTDQYYKRIDQTMRKKFPEYFELDGDDSTVETKENQTSQRTKPSTVVAPATRSTSSKQVRLKASQMALIKKLGLSPEQYSREVLKLEV